MRFKEGQCTEKLWRYLRRFQQLPKVIESIQFVDGFDEPLIYLAAPRATTQASSRAIVSVAGEADLYSTKLNTHARLFGGQE